MRFSKLLLLAVIFNFLLSIPLLADTWTQFSNPGDGGYLSSTNFGGGDGSLAFISALGPFTYSNPQSENSVPGSWATWGSPPDTESATPNVLFNAGFSTLHADVNDTLAGSNSNPTTLLWKRSLSFSTATRATASPLPAM